MDTPAGVVFLGVIAFSSLIQGAFLVALAVGGLRLARRVEEIRKAVDGEIRPAIENLSQVTENLAQVSELAAVQAQRIQTLVGETIATIDHTTAQLRHAARRPLDSFRDVGALVKGVRRGVEVYRRLGGLHAQRHGHTRKYGDDEHLFI
jgi:hypothetical protein